MWTIELRRIIRKAIRDGKIIKPDKCEECGKPTKKKSLCGHHDDYSKPFEIRWLCYKCHSIAKHKVGIKTRFQKGHRSYWKGKKNPNVSGDNHWKRKLMGVVGVVAWYIALLGTAVNRADTSPGKPEEIIYRRPTAQSPTLGVDKWTTYTLKT